MLHSDKVLVFSPLEISLFLVLLAASMGGFWLRFGKVVHKIREAKPDADFRLAQMGKRAWDFVQSTHQFVPESHSLPN